MCARVCSPSYSLVLALILILFPVFISLAVRWLFQIHYYFIVLSTLVRRFYMFGWCWILIMKWILQNIRIIVCTPCLEHYRLWLWTVFPASSSPKFRIRRTRKNTQQIRIILNESVLCWIQLDWIGLDWCIQFLFRIIRSLACLFVLDFLHYFCNFYILRYTFNTFEIARARHRQRKQRLRSNHYTHTPKSKQQAQYRQPKKKQQKNTN